jgi:N-methylhydantoinase A
VTDANVVLGLLSPDYFLGGAMQLDRSRAERAVMQGVAKPLGLTVEQGAQAIFEIVNSNMVDAIQVVTVQRGYDPRDFSLVAAGGASPIHTSILARSLGIRRVIVPKASSVFCALGGLQADAKYDYVSTFMARSSEIDPTQLAGELEKLAEQGRARLDLDGVPQSQRQLQFSLDMRYVGQHWDISVPLTLSQELPDIQVAIGEFHHRHDMLHGYRMDERETEIVNCRLMAIGRSPRIELRRPRPAEVVCPVTPKAERSAYFGAESSFLKAPVFDGDALQTGDSIEGPAIIERSNTTVVVLPRERLRVDEHDSLVIDLE